MTAKLGIKGDETVLDTDIVVLRKSFDARNKKVGVERGAGRETGVDWGVLL